jgi:hypothetical protein
MKIQNIIGLAFIYTIGCVGDATPEDGNKIFGKADDSILGSDQINGIVLDPNCTDNTAQIQEIFNIEVLPILVAHCASCHSGSNPSAGLNLTSIQAFRNVVTSAGYTNLGDANGSLLFNKVASGSMPPGDNNLNGIEVSAIENWINQNELILDCTPQEELPTEEPVEEPEAEPPVVVEEPEPVPDPVVTETPYLAEARMYAGFGNRVYLNIDDTKTPTYLGLDQYGNTMSEAPTISNYNFYNQQIATFIDGVIYAKGAGTTTINVDFIDKKGQLHRSNTITVIVEGGPTSGGGVIVGAYE